METDFNFKSQICTTREQSERLLALGLKKETADMYITNMSIKGINYTDDWQIGSIPYCNVMSFWDSKGLQLEKTAWSIVPTWSLHRLIEMMPKCVRAHSSGDDSPRLHPYVPKFDYLGVTIENIDEILADFYQHTDLFDNIIECIEWLIKEGYFNKEYYENGK